MKNKQISRKSLILLGNNSKNKNKQQQKNRKILELLFFKEVTLNICIKVPELHLNFKNKTKNSSKKNRNKKNSILHTHKQKYIKKERKPSTLYSRQ